MFFHHDRGLKFGAPSRYYKGALTLEQIGLLSDLILMLAGKNLKKKHSKFDIQFFIRCLIKIA